MNFDNNLMSIPGTKRVRYTCIECGDNKEAYVHSNGKKMYCSAKCAAISRARQIKNKAAKNQRKIKKIVPESIRDFIKLPPNEFINVVSKKGKLIKLTCITCNIEFERICYTGRPLPKFCKRTCIRKSTTLALIKDNEIKSRIKWTCEGCSKIFYRMHRKGFAEPRFCTVICKNKSITNAGKTIHKRDLPKTIIIQKPDNESHKCTINRFVFYTCLATNVVLMYYIVMK